MDLEKLERRINVIADRLNEMGYGLLEDLKDLIEQRPDIAEEILEYKLKKIEYFEEKEKNRIGFVLKKHHITFEYSYGEDEEGAWYDLEARVLDMDAGDDE